MGYVGKYKTKRGQDKYFYVFDAPRGPTGKRRQVERRGCRTKKEAQDKLSLAEAASLGGMSPADGRQVLSSYLNGWLVQVRPGLENNTFRSYSSLVRCYLVPGLGHVRLDRLTGAMIRQFLLTVERPGAKGRPGARTVQYIHRVLSMALDSAVPDLLARNPALGTNPPAPRRREMKTLAGPAVVELLEKLKGTSLYLAAVLAVSTGMRRGEVCGLRWEDVDLDSGTVMIRRSIEPGRVVKGTKTGREKTIPLPEFAVEVLREFHRIKKTDWVMETEDGGPWNPGKVSVRWSRMAKQHGIPITFHGLRHTQATLLFAAGVHPKVVQERLGHRSIAITLDIYSHVVPGMQEDAAKKLNGILGPEKGV